MKTRLVAAPASALTALVLASCASSQRPAPAVEVSVAAPEPAPVPMPRRVVHPFGSQLASSSSPARSESAPPNADGSRRGLSSAPSYEIFGSSPETRLPGIDESETFESTENVRRVTSADEGADFDPAVSPCGQWLYFASTRHRPTSDIYAKRVDGTAVTLLTSDASNDVMPAVSPDGRRIAFASNRAGSYDIYVMSASGGQPVQVTSDPGQELKPTWSPDGRYLAFCRVADGRASDRWEIWVSEVNRPSNTRFLTFGLFPAWQPGGDKIAFQRGRERGSRYFSIWTVDFTDGDALNPTEVVTSPVAACINPTWSPDGAFIAFSTVVAPESAPGTGTVPALAARFAPTQADLWIVRADGSSRAPLTAGATANLSPAWGTGTGGGDRVFFVSNRSGSDNVWSIGTQGAMVAMGVTEPGATARASAPSAALSESGTAEHHVESSQPAAATADGGEPDHAEPAPH